MYDYKSAYTKESTVKLINRFPTKCKVISKTKHNASIIRLSTTRCSELILTCLMRQFKSTFITINSDLSLHGLRLAADFECAAQLWKPKAVTTNIYYNIDLKI